MITGSWIEGTGTAGVTKNDSPVNLGPANALRRGALIDEAAIWNRALTTNEVVSIANFPNGRVINLYATDNPTIQPQTAFSTGNVIQWTTFSETLGAGSTGTINYQLSDDGGVTWKYWNGGSWAVAASTANANTSANLTPAVMQAFPTASSQITFKAFFASDGFMPVILDNVSINEATLNYSFMIVPVTTPFHNISYTPTRDYSTLQSAVDDALANHIIIIDSGIYDEGSASTINKSLTIRSTTGVSTDVRLDGGGSHRLIYISAGTVTFNNLIMQNGYTSDNGGGILLAGGSLVLQYVQGLNCTGNNGGFVYAGGASLQTDYCLISGNYVAASGAGIYNTGPYAGNHDIFSANRALNGAAVYNANATAESEGAGSFRVCHNPNTPAEQMKTNISWTAVPGHLGHGDYLGACSDSSNYSGNWNIFQNNSAQSGGAIYQERGTYKGHNNLFTGNTASQNGAAVYQQFGNYYGYNNVYYGNISLDKGGSVYLNKGFLKARNNIYYNNNAVQGSQIYIVNIDGVSILYSDLPSGNAGIFGYTFVGKVGNTVSDPLFINPSAGNFHLQGASSLADAGQNSVVNWSSDLDNNTRIQGLAVDMGLYEGSVTINPLVPMGSEENIPTNSLVTFEVVGWGSSINIASLIVTINGTKLAAGSIVNTAIGNSFRVTADPGTQFNYGSQVTVDIYVQSTGGNPYTLTYPFFINSILPISPAAGAIAISTSANLVLDVFDYQTSINISSLVVTVNGVRAVASEIASGSIANGFRVTVNPGADFAYGSIVTVDAYLLDINNNAAVLTYLFTVVSDSTAPTINPVTPTAGAIAISTSTNLVLDVFDYQTSINISSLVVTVNGVRSVASEIVSGSITNGFRVTINPSTDFAYGSTISVDVFIQDTNNNSVTLSYTFAVNNDSTAPTVNPISPIVGANSIATFLNTIVFDIQDTESSISLNSLKVTINQTVVAKNNSRRHKVMETFEITTFNAFIDPAISYAPTLNGYRVSIVLADPLAFDRPVTLAIEVQNSSGIFATLNYTFAIEKRNSPYPFPGQGYKFRKNLDTDLSTTNNLRSDIIGTTVNISEIEDVRLVKTINNIEVGYVSINATSLGLNLYYDDFSDIVISKNEFGLPYVTVPTDNPLALTVNARSGSVWIPAAFGPFTSVPIITVSTSNQFIPITRWNGAPATTTETNRIRNFNYDTTTGYVSFEVNQFSTYGSAIISTVNIIGFPGTGNIGVTYNFAVQVLDTNGNAVEAAPVTINVVSGSATVSYPNGTTTNAGGTLNVNISFIAINTNNIEAYSDVVTSTIASVFIYDSIVPTINPVTPTNGAVEVATTANLIFDVFDYQTSININSLVVTINGLRVTAGEISSVSIANGFRITVNRFTVSPYGSIISVNIYIEDTNGNPVTLAYTFAAISDSTPPNIALIHPAPGESLDWHGVDNVVMIEVTDFQSSVLSGSIVTTFNHQVVDSHGVIDWNHFHVISEEHIFNGTGIGAHRFEIVPTTNGYLVSISDEEPLSFESWATLNIEAQNSAGLIATVSFVIRIVKRDAPYPFQDPGYVFGTIVTTDLSTVHGSRSDIIGATVNVTATANVQLARVVNGIEYGHVSINANALGLNLFNDDFSDIVISRNIVGLPYITIPTTNALAATVNASLNPLWIPIALGPFSAVPVITVSTGNQFVSIVGWNGAIASSTESNRIRNYSYNTATNYAYFEVNHFTTYGSAIVSTVNLLGLPVTGNAGTTYNFTVQVLDTNGNSLEAAPVTINYAAGSAIVAFPNGPTTNAGGTLNVAISFSAAGTNNISAYCEVATSAASAIYINVNIPPTINPVSPIAGATGVATNTDVIFDIVDYQASLNMNSLMVTVNGLRIAAELITTAAITNGYRVIVNPTANFAYGSTISVSVYVLDSISTQVTSNYSFTTIADLPPSITPSDPLAGATSVPTNNSIILNITDLETGISLNTLSMIVSGSLINTGLITKTAIANGYRLTHTPSTNFSYSQLVSVLVSVADTNSNLASLSYSFTTAAEPPAAIQQGPSIPTDSLAIHRKVAAIAEQNNANDQTGYVNRSAKLSLSAKDTSGYKIVSINISNSQTMADGIWYNLTDLGLVPSTNISISNFSWAFPNGQNGDTVTVFYRVRNEYNVNSPIVANSVVLDLIPPQGTITLSALAQNGFKVASVADRRQISMLATDNFTATNRLEMMVTGDISAGPSVNVWLPYTTQFSVTLNPVDYPIVKIYVLDLAGNISILQNDPIPPTIISLQLDNKGIVTGDYVGSQPVLSITATDNVSLASYRVFVYSAGLLVSNYLTTNITPVGSTSAVINLTLPILAEGDNNVVEVVVIDSAGNQTLARTGVFRVRLSEVFTFVAEPPAPNPFNSNTEESHLGYQLNRPATVKLYIHAFNGDLMYSNEKTSAIGYDEFTWNGRDQFGDKVDSGGYVGYLIAEYDGFPIKRKVKIAVLKR